MRGLARYLSPELRAARRKRFEKVSYGVNGVIFFCAAWNGATSVPPDSPLLIWTSIVSGVIQFGTLLWFRRTALPERVPQYLAAAGMFVNAVATSHHHTGIQYAYLLAGLLYLSAGLPGVRRIAERVRREEPSEESE